MCGTIACNTNNINHSQLPLLFVFPLYVDFCMSVAQTLGMNPRTTVQTELSREEECTVEQNEAGQI